MQSLGMREVTLTKEDILYFMDRLSAEFKLFASSHRYYQFFKKLSFFGPCALGLAYPKLEVKIMICIK